MPPALLVALAVAVVIVLAWALRRRTKRDGFESPNPQVPAAASGPYNIGLYNAPYFYPKYEALAETSWDADKRCVAYCGQSPCVVWCR